MSKAALISILMLLSFTCARAGELVGIKTILDPGTAEAVSTMQKNAWATLKFRDAPWAIVEIKAFSNRYRVKH
jgi:hypothetical protein